MAAAGMLIVALLGLLAGPMLLGLAPHGRVWRRWLDGLCLSLVGGLSILHLLPHAVEHGGPIALLVAVVSAIVPGLLHRHGDGAHSRWNLGLFALLLLHAAVDGAALALLDDTSSSLSIAVAAHRVPVGLVVFATARQLAPRAGWLSILLLSLATVGGFFGSDAAAHLLHGHHWLEGVLEAAVAGALLHILFDHHGIIAHLHGPDDHDHDHDHAPEPAEVGWSALGAVTGLVAVAVSTAVSADSHALDHIAETSETFWTLALDSAPALLLGYLLSGLIPALLTPSSAHHLSTGGPLRQAGRGLVFGLPLTVCSHGVLPQYAALVRGGVPATAALAFLVATPELGLDAVLLSVPLLGLPLAIARAAAALVVALLAALIVGRFLPAPAAPPAPAPALARAPLGQRVAQGMRYALVVLVDHTMPWIAAGLLLAALAEPLLGHALLQSLPPVAQVPLFALAAIPAYVSAAGATPLAAVAVHKGISAGAALAFLLAGPVTNVTAFALLSALHGRRAAIGFGLVVVSLAVLAGWTVDAAGLAMPEVLHTEAAEPHGPLAWASLGVLAALMLGSLFRQGPRGMVHQLTSPVRAH